MLLAINGFFSAAPLNYICKPPIPVVPLHSGCSRRSPLMGYLKYRVLRDALRRLRYDERGNIFILFAASVIPLLLFMGGAVDVARFARYRADLANAVDSAALALARQHDDYTEE